MRFSTLCYIIILFVMCVAQFGLILTPLMGSASGGVRIIAGFSLLIPIIIYVAYNNRMKYWWIAFLLFAIYMFFLNVFGGNGIIAYLYMLPAYMIYFSLFFIFKYLYNVSPHLFYKLCSIFVFSCIFLLFGLILDFFFDLSEMLSLPIIKDADSTIRPSFLLSSPTATFTVGICGFIVFYCAFYNKISRYYYLLYLILLLLASALSLSRLPLILSLVYIVYFFFTLKKSFYSKLTIFSIMAYVLVSNYDFLLLEAGFYMDKFFLIFDASDVGNSTRFIRWQEATSSFGLFTNYFGHGFGSSSPNLSRLLGFEYIGHFESSLFTMWIEAGIFGIILVILFLRFLYIKDFHVLFGLLLLCTNLLVAPLYANYQVPFCVVFSLVVIYRLGFLKGRDNV